MKRKEILTMGFVVILGLSLGLIFSLVAPSSRTNKVNTPKAPKLVSKGFSATLSASPKTVTATKLGKDGTASASSTVNAGKVTVKIDYENNTDEDLSGIILHLKMDGVKGISLGDMTNISFDPKLSKDPETFAFKAENVKKGARQSASLFFIPRTAGILKIQAQLRSSNNKTAITSVETVTAN